MACDQHCEDGAAHTKGTVHDSPERAAGTGGADQVDDETESEGASNMRGYSGEPLVEARGRESKSGGVAAFEPGGHVNGALHVVV